MSTICVRELLPGSILASRDSMSVLQEALSAKVQHEMAFAADNMNDEVSIDFGGIDGMGPSCVDQMLIVLEATLATNGIPGLRAIRIANPPTRLSSKFEAVARGHARTVQALPDGSWLFTKRSDDAT